MVQTLNSLEIKLAIEQIYEKTWQKINQEGSSCFFN